MTYYDNLKIEEDVTLGTLNRTIGTLLENDSQMSRHAKSPQIWECIWYNLNDSVVSCYGYGKGDSVWLNTQDVDEFVRQRKDDIFQYLKDYQPAYENIRQLSSDGDSLIEFYKSVIDGNNEFDERHRYLYYVGNLSSNTQIRISKVDNNTYPPNDNRYWEDFIRRDNDEAYYSEVILSVLDQQQNLRMDQHLKTYHLQGLVGRDGKYKTVSDFSDRFLDKDLGNSSGGQRYLSHQYAKSMTGFDYVVEMSRITYENGCDKWFRIWSSGLLEHGGTVLVDTENLTPGDSLHYGNQYYQVSLGWAYGNSTARTYDYPTIRYGQFYMRDGKIGDGYGNSFQYNTQDNALDWTYRYQVQITPFSTGDEIESPYYFHTGSTTPHYTIREVTNMTNDSFRFKYSEKFERYSYYTRGFVKNV